MIDLGTPIRRRREQAGLSQLDLAMAVGYKNGGDISRVETGKQWPDGAKLAAIAEQLNCAVWELVAESEGVVLGTRETPQRYRAKSQQVQTQGTRPEIRDPLAPPTLDDALKDVRFMLTETDSPELLAAIAYQGLMTRYATDRICSALNSLIGAVESLRDEVETAGKRT